MVTYGATRRLLQGRSQQTAKNRAERARFEKSDFITLRHLSTYDASRKYVKTYFSFKVTLGNWRSFKVIRILAQVYTNFTRIDLYPVFELSLLDHIRPMSQAQFKVNDPSAIVGLCPGQ